MNTHTHTDAALLCQRRCAAVLLPYHCVAALLLYHCAAALLLYHCVTGRGDKKANDTTEPPI
eukprot:5379672-Pyramimonas_sp.AAC.1